MKWMMVTAVALMALVLWASAGDSRAEAQPRAGMLNVTPLGMYDAGSFLLLDNETGKIWKYEKFSIPDSGVKEGDVELWGTLTAPGEPIQLADPGS